MREFKSIESAEARIEAIKKEQAEKLAAIKAEQDKDNEAIAAAEKAIEDAVKNDNVKAYQNAKEAARKAADVKELHDRRRNLYGKEALISLDEYNEIVDAMRAEFAEYDKEKAAEIMEMLKKMVDISKEYFAIYNYANSIIRNLYNNILHNGEESHLSPHDRRSSVIADTWTGVYAGQVKEHEFYKRHMND